MKKYIILDLLVLVLLFLFSATVFALPDALTDGAGVAYKRAMINLGTSGCCMFVIPNEVLGGRIIDGVFGQAESCIIPGLVGFEVGLSAFGDAYAWLRRTLAYPTVEILAKSNKIDPQTRQTLVDEVLDNILIKLGEDAAKITPRLDAPFATDWFNGRRSPDDDPLATGSLLNLTLATSAPEIFKALVEATAFGSRAINERLSDEGLRIDTILAVGGISKKSRFVMQTMADVIGLPIRVVSSTQACALGSAMNASVAAGVHPSVEAAQEAMSSGFDGEYTPNDERHAIYNKLYTRYRRAAYGE